MSDFIEAMRRTLSILGDPKTVSNIIELYRNAQKTGSAEQENFVNALYDIFGEDKFLPLLVEGLDFVLLSLDDTRTYRAERSRPLYYNVLSDYDSLMLSIGIDRANKSSYVKNLVDLIQANYKDAEDGEKFSSFLKEVENKTFIQKVKAGSIILPHLSGESEKDKKDRLEDHKPTLESFSSRETPIIPLIVNSAHGILFFNQPGPHGNTIEHRVIGRLFSLVQEKYKHSTDPFAEFEKDLRECGEVSEKILNGHSIPEPTEDGEVEFLRRQQEIFSSADEIRNLTLEEFERRFEEGMNKRFKPNPITSFFLPPERQDSLRLILSLLTDGKFRF